MFPDRQKAIELLEKASINNPGLWVKHSYLVAECAKKIANRCNMDGDKAYVLGLLHDIGRNFGISQFKHILDGYTYMNELGYDEVAKVCLTHSFVNHSIDEYVGICDISNEDYNMLKNVLENLIYDDYDKLVQLCDALAGTEIVSVEERMEDVKKRYGNYPEEKWKSTLLLKKYFEDRCSENIYVVVEAKGDFK